MHPSWQTVLADQIETLKQIEAELTPGYLPSAELVMKAFQRDLADVKVVIVGQDPYPTPGHAIGLSFAVRMGTALPRSLVNMMKELGSDLQDQALAGQVTLGGDLSHWAHQGVLLINRELTIPGHKLWESFTDAALRALVQARAGRIVVILWGNHAAKAEPAVAGAVVIRSAHPSPLSASRGFFGSRPYSRTNEALVGMGLAPIDWSC